MAKNLVIVESPTKAKTIEGFLGKEYTVKASQGHVRDLNKNTLSVDIDKNFEPEYEIPDDKKALVAELRKLSKAADTVWLASDEDREGESISWHLYEVLDLKKRTPSVSSSMKSLNRPSRTPSRTRATSIWDLSMRNRLAVCLTAL
jgi:DNA topoisomerase-1